MRYKLDYRYTLEPTGYSRSATRTVTAKSVAQAAEKLSKSLRQKFVGECNVEITGGIEDDRGSCRVLTQRDLHPVNFPEPDAVLS